MKYEEGLFVHQLVDTLNSTPCWYNLAHTTSLTMTDNIDYLAQ